VEKIGRYTILEKIGEGGMGIVYKARDPVIERIVAIKSISALLGVDASTKSRFLREARSAGQLNHKNIITIYDLGTEEGQVYLAMEYLEGEDLKTKISKRVPMCLEEKLQIIIQVCEGLSHAHSRQIVHRDIKPGNIFITSSGQVKILDFGLAQYVASDVSRSGFLGTPSYSSPELLRGGVVDQRSDIFALGVVLYELLSFQKPFTGESFPAVLYKILEFDPEPLSNTDPTIPPELSKIVQRTLAKKPEQRYQRLDEVLKDLEDFISGKDPAAEPGRQAAISGDQITSTREAADLLQSAAARADQDTAQSADNADDVPSPADERIPPSAQAAGTPDKPQELVGSSWLTRKRMIWISLCVIIVLAVSMEIMRTFREPPTLHTVQVDASPWAKVTIISDKQQIIQAENDTPFQIRLPSGIYVFRFVHESQSRDIPITITNKPMGTIRCEFGSTEPWRTILPTDKGQQIEGNQ
jgi:hypothetical protein